MEGNVQTKKKGPLLGSIQISLLLSHGWAVGKHSHQLLVFTSVLPSSLVLRLLVPFFVPFLRSSLFSVPPFFFLFTELGLGHGGGHGQGLERENKQRHRHR